jgi:4-amino-4-deoxy-L-arabinose transferase-like glycosyltransferase
MFQSKRMTILLSLLGLALALRLVAAVVIDRHVSSAGRQFLIEGDANGYWELGKRIAAGEEYSLYSPPRRILRTPGFPLLLAASIRVFGESVFAATIVMACVGAACCWLTWRLAKQLADETTAIIALMIVAVSPLQIGSNVQILSETWFSFWLLLTLISMARLLIPAEESVSVPRTEKWQTRRRAVVSGILTGITVLVRPGWILWPWFSSAFLAIFGRWSVPQRILIAVLIFGGCYVALSPWALRNHGVSGHWVFTSLWSGPSLYDGLNSGATGESDMQFFDNENVMATMSEYQMNDHYKQRAWEFARSNPVRTVQLAVLKSMRYLSPSLNAAGFSGGLFAAFCLVWHAAFFVFALTGAWVWRKRPEILFILIGPFVQFLLVHMVFVGSIRYRLPVEFPLSIVAARGIVAVLDRFRKADIG